jgi:hypothetical protein
MAAAREAMPLVLREALAARLAQQAKDTTIKASREASRDIPIKQAVVLSVPMAAHKAHKAQREHIAPRVRMGAASRTMMSTRNITTTMTARMLLSLALPVSWAVL